MAVPQLGERILVLRPNWLELIISGEKTLEIRGRNLCAGKYWLGCRGRIDGRAVFEPAFQIQSAATWHSLRHQHRVETDELPYKTTFGIPVRFCERVSPPISYTIKRGAVGIVKYAPTV